MTTGIALIYPALLAVLTENNYTIFSDETGVPYLIKIDNSPLTELELTILGINVESISFNLYTRDNPTIGDVINLNDIVSVRKSHWNPHRETIIVTHGWNSNGRSSSCTLVRDAFLNVWDSNVIIVDWGKIAKNLLYSVVAKSVPRVALRVADFVNFLQTGAGLRTSKLKIVGHSLGAHVAGLSALEIGTRSSQVAEVIALDAAKPMFEHKGPDGRVDKSDARNVQVIHTCAGYLGLDISVGTSDFFANDGRNQPGCVNDLIGACAHSRSYEYYSESVMKSKGFLGVSQNGTTAYMGGPTLDPKAKGTYTFQTKNQYPYAPGG